MRADAPSSACDRPCRCECSECSELPICADRRPAGSRHPTDFARRQRDLRPVARRGRSSSPRRRHCGRAGRRGRAASRCCESAFPAESAPAAAQLPTFGSTPSAAHRPCRRPPGRSAPGCTASRRRRSAAGRCGPMRFGSYSMNADLGRNVVLVPLEVDDAVLRLVTAAAMAGGDLALVVAAGRLLQPHRQRLLGLLLAVGDFSEVAHRRIAAPGGGRFVLANSHDRFRSLTSNVSQSRRDDSRRRLRRTRSGRRGAA